MCAASRKTSSQLQALHEFRGDDGDAPQRRLGKRKPWPRDGIEQNDPQAGAVDFFIARTNGPGKLRNLERVRPRRQVHFQNAFVLVALRRGSGNQFGQDAARIIHQVAEALRNKYAVNITRRGLLELVRYATDLRSLSHGTGTSSRSFVRYDPMPPHVAAKVTDGK